MRKGCGAQYHVLPPNMIGHLESLGGMGGSSSKSHPCPPPTFQCIMVTLSARQDGTPWALYAMADDGQKLPQSDQCQDCYELWRQGFGYLDWATLCKTHEQSLEFATVVAKARAVKHGQAKVEGHPQEVHSGRKVMLQVERSMVVASEKELRRMTKLPRIGKTMLKNIPSLVVGGEDGGEVEKVYAFQDESAPLRKAKLIVQCETGMTSLVMPQQAVIFEDQAPPWFKHITEGQASDTGMKDFWTRRWLAMTTCSPSTTCCRSLLASHWRVSQRWWLPRW